MARSLNASDLIALRWTDAHIDLNRFSASVRTRVASMIRLLQEDLVEQVHKFDLEGIPGDATKRKRAEALIKHVEGILESRYRTAEQRLKSGMREIASVTHDASIEIINEIFTVDIAKPTLTREELKVLADRNIVLGEPAKDWWEGQAEGTRRKFAREIRKGVLAGKTNQEIIQAIRGKATGRTILVELPNGKTRRVNEFAGGVMDVSTAEADALVRTSVQSVSNAAMMETYKANQDIFKGWRALTTLDTRTSPICIARTGAAWDLEGNPLPDSTRDEPFPGTPPWHYSCRTVLTAITKSWAELIEEASGQRMKVLEEVPNKVRASMDGLITKGNVHSFDDWLEIKGDDFARKKLGPALFDLWKDDKISLSQLIDDAGNIRTVTELRESIGLKRR